MRMGVDPVIGVPSTLAKAGRAAQIIKPMNQPNYALLPDRAVLAVDGPEARSFLQGLISNDIDKATADHGIYAALLTPQGKFLFDFLIVEQDGRLLFDAEAARRADLKKRLTFYKLRAKAMVADEDGIAAVAAFGAGAGERLGLGPEPGAAKPFGGGVAMTDPRLPALGARLLLPRDGAEAALQAAGLAPADAAAYDRWRLSHGVPDGSRDIEVERGFLLESNFEELNGVDFQKGCYVGQELTARTKYRGVVRKRLMRVDVDGPLPAPGTPIMLGETEAGEMRSGRDGLGLAMIRLEQLEKAAGAPLSAGEAKLKPVKPAWAAF
jgi:folate-binding protein YgfZ